MNSKSPIVKKVSVKRQPFQVGRDLMVREATLKSFEEAQKIIDEAKSTVKAIEEEAFRKGQLRNQEQLRVLWEEEKKDLIQRFEMEKTTLLKQLEADMLQLVLGVAEKVIRQEIKQDKNTIVQLIQNGLSQINANEAFTIKVHPDEVEAVKAQISPSSVEPDASLEPGDYKIETDTTQVDGRVQGQLDETKQELKFPTDNDHDSTD